jgi:hypothetical protein
MNRAQVEKGKENCADEVSENGIVTRKNTLIFLGLAMLVCLFMWVSVFMSAMVVV